MAWLHAKGEYALQWSSQIQGVFHVPLPQSESHSHLRGCSSTLRRDSSQSARLAARRENSSPGPGSVRLPGSWLHPHVGSSTPEPVRANQVHDIRREQVSWKNLGC